MKTAALIVAGGMGTRAGGGLPKHFRVVGGKPVLSWTLMAFCKHKDIERVQVVISPGMEDECAKALEALDASPAERKKIHVVVAGGDTRQKTALNGLLALRDSAPEQVLVHDSARPFVTPKIIDDVLGGLKGNKAVIPVLPMEDTVKMRKGGTLETLDRSQLVRVQTPQGFKYADIIAAHEKYADHQTTDDAGLAELAGIEVHTVAGDEDNRKITFPIDFAIAEQIIRRRSQQRS